jgi:alkylresorcinol/alkylpyrone synthase
MKTHGASARSLRLVPTATPAAFARVCGVGSALPKHYYDQETLLAAFEELWGDAVPNPRRLAQLHRSVLVGGRHLAVSVEEHRRLGSFTEASATYVRCATDLGAQALSRALGAAGLRPSDLDHVFFVSVTGIATPSIDARLVNRLGLRSDVKRTPIFGLGCVAGAAGLARAADYVRAYPMHRAALVSVELCSLTLQRRDVSVRNLIASGLFGDGAAAVIVGGRVVGGSGPEVLATRSVFYPDTEETMGWEVTSDGFRVVLSADVPTVVRRHVREDVDRFLAEHGLTRGDVGTYVCHPGGPKVLEALQEALEVPAEALQVTWDSLRRVGNVSSASVLMVLQDTLATRRPAPGTYGLMLGMGPGFCSELVLLRW